MKKHILERGAAGWTGLRSFVMAGAVAWAGLVLLPGAQAGASTSPATTGKAGQTNAPIAWNELGAKATSQYSGGEALAVTPTAGGMTLRCDFQRLAGEVTPGGLWLVSTVTNAPASRFCVVAAAVGRQGGIVAPLPAEGTVSGDTKSARFVRPGLTEEYSVSVDGVRQDFVVAQAPAGAGELRVELAVQGARAEAADPGARLVLDGSGRALAYSRLRVVDATGRALTARIEVPSAGRLAVCVNDAAAVYPVRIDPTFSDANWVALGGHPGANATVYALATDGSGNIYAGGAFTLIGSTSVNYIAKWNGSTWSALGSGVNSYVQSLACSGGILYAGGVFTTAGGISASYIASWNGTSWSALGSGLNNMVSALAVSGSTLYAGGNFTRAGGYSANGIAKWNGTSWSSVGFDYTGDSCSVSALAVSGGTLYAGGSFQEIGGVSANNIASWNGSSWSPLGAGLEVSTTQLVDILGYEEEETVVTNAGAFVNALAVSGSTLYVGGQFNVAGGASAYNVASWNGSTWSALGSGLNNGAVNALAVSGSTLYAGGTFNLDNDSGQQMAYTATWNGTSWSPIAGTTVTPGGYIYAMFASGGTLYIGGHFSSSYLGGPVYNNIVAWNGTSFSSVGAGLNGQVNAVAVSGSTLYVGGNFTQAGNAAANYIASWGGTGWSALGTGLNAQVNALAFSGNTLYAGGNFTQAGGATADYIANWNGTSWSGVGGGLNNTVNALAVSGGTLYAGGLFSGSISGTTLNYIGSWNGTTWSAMNGGVNQSVYALAFYGGNLIAAGDLTAAGPGGTIATHRIASWNGTTWSTLGTGMDSGIRALAVSSNYLYAGGYFAQAGGVQAYYVARWNGTSWSPLGSPTGFNNLVLALAFSDGSLYAGGEFTTAGGITANYAAVWNGENGTAAWSPFGTSPNGYVNALAAVGGTVYLGGAFTQVGPYPSYYAAEATFAPALTLTSSANPTTYGQSVTLTATASAATATLPTGTVTFYSGTTLLGTGTLSSLTATLTTTALPVGTDSLTAVYGGDGNFSSSTNTTPLSQTVNGITVTVTSGLSANSKTYDGTTTATLSSNNVVLSGVLVADAANVELSTNGYTAAFATAGAANGVGVTVGGLTLTGSAAGNYSLTPPSGFTANITRKALTAQGSLALTSKVYDGTTSATPTGAAALQATEAAGSGTASDGIPYAVDSVSLTGPPAYAFNSSTVAGATTVTASGLSLTGTGSGNYTLTPPSLSATITPKPLTAQGTLALTSKVYDGTTGATPTGGPLLQFAEAPGGGTTADGKPYSGDSVLLTGTAAYAFNTKEVTTANTVTTSGLSLTGTGSGNYTLTQPSLSATITPKPLNYAGISAVSKVYDGTRTATFAGTAAPLAAEAAGTGTSTDGNPYTGDSVSFTTGSLTGTFASAAVLNGIDITLTGGVSLAAGGQSSDYSVGSPVPAFAANITPATVTITSGITANNKIYDATTTATITSNNVVLRGVVSGDVADVALATNGYTATFASAPVANGIAVTVDGLTLTGSAAGNYSLTQPTGLSANITPGPVTGVQSTVTASPASVVADGHTTSTITVTLLDAYGNPVSGKTVTLTQTSGDGTPVISAASGPSSASGVVTFTVKSSTPAPAGDGFTAADATDTVTIAQTATVAFTALQPVATPMTVVVPTGLPALISLSDLATNWSDFYGYPLTLTAINFTSADNLTVYPINLTTTGGAYAISSSAFLGYVNPAPSVSDQITYTISDGHGNTTNGVINIIGSASPLFGQVTGLLHPGGNAVTVNFAGQPGYTYHVERSQDMITWQSIWTTNAPPAGPFSYTDTFGDLGGLAPASAYYRLAWWPFNQ